MGQGNFKGFLQANLQRLSLDTEDTEEFLLRLEYSVFYPLFWLSYKPIDHHL